MENVIIIGSGPAAHTAGIYLARSNLGPLMFEGDSSNGLTAGGLLTMTKIVENYPGFPDGIDGGQLTDNFRQQSVNFGVKVISENVIGVVADGKDFIVKTAVGEHRTKSVIIATGSTPKHLDCDGYKQFWHKGISTCAVCDGSLKCYRNVPLAVVGGGDSACEEAMHLSKTASIVYLIHRKDSLRASHIMQAKVKGNSKIQIIWDTEVVKVTGDKMIEELALLKKTGVESVLKVGGLFVAIGHTPNSQFVSDLVKVDDDGYIVTDAKKMTTVEGIWAAGDVQDKVYRQAIVAAGSGCIAALECERWLSM